MAAESNVGIRLFLIGKDAVIGGLKEVSAGVAKTAATIDKMAASQKGLAAATSESEVETESFTVRLKAARDAGMAYGEAWDFATKQMEEAAVAARVLDAELVGMGKDALTAAALNKDVAAKNAAAMDSMAAVGKKTFFGLTAAAAVIGYESIKWASAYQTQLTRLGTQAGLTATQVASIGRAAMSNAAALGITPTQYVEAAYHPASAGLGVATSIGITEQAANLTAISGANVDDNANSLTSLMKVYGLKGPKNAAKQAAFVNAVVGSGNMKLTDLNKAIGTAVFTTAKGFGVSEGSVGSALAFMTDRGVGATQAGTRLRMGLALMGAPSQIAAKYEADAGLSTVQQNKANNAMTAMLQASGLTTTRLADDMRKNGGKNGIYNALEDIKTSLTRGGVDKKLQASFISRTFGGGRSGTAVQLLYDNLPQVNKKTSQINRLDNQKKYLDDLAKAHATLAFQVHALSASFQTLGITLGNALIPVMKVVTTLLRGVTGFLEKNKAVAVGLATAITLVLVPAIGVYLKRALLSTGGSINTVIKAYGRLFGAQAAEDASIGVEDAALATNDASLATNDAALISNDAAEVSNIASRGGAIGGVLKFLGGKGGVVVGAAAADYGMHLLGSHATSVINNEKAKTLKTKAALLRQINSLKADMKKNNGGLLGKVESTGPFGDVGRFFTAEHVPWLENNTAGKEAEDKVLLGQYQSQLKKLEKTDPKSLVDPTMTSPDGLAKQLTINLHADINIDGKKVTHTVIKNVKKKASLS